MSNYHVIQRGKQWAALREGADRVADLCDTQHEAEKAAKEHAHNTGGGEVKIHGRDGKIRDSDTISPGHDPCPPRDQRH